MEDDIINDEDEDYNNYEDDYIENEINEENENVQNQENNNNQLIDFEIIQNSEIIKKRDAIINNFMECSNLSYDEAELVLVYYNWNYDKLIEEWFDKTENIKISSHIEQSPESEKKMSEFISNNNLSSDICPVCYTEIEKDNCLSLKCNHQICKECYIEYINNKLLTDPITILQTSCPMNGCNLYITRTLYKNCITELKYKKIFAKNLIRNFLITNKEIKTCPNPKCNLSIRVQNSIAKEIKCKCGQTFCFSCLEESHIPCDCFLAKEWLNFGTKFGGKEYVWEKKGANTENIFIITNDLVKNCPKCLVVIEKNHGCNHMTCTCGYQFCWVCLSPWKNGCYSCRKVITPKTNPLSEFIKIKKTNKYIPGKLKKKEEEKLTPFERYMKYYKKWHNHFKNLEICDKVKERLSELKNELIEDKNILENDVTFLDDSLNTIIDCNRALKYIFIFEYFLKDEDADIEDLIDNNLDTLQKQVDSLLELVELDQLPNILKISDKDNFKKKFLEYKDHIISLMNSTENFKKKLVDEIQNNLLDNIDYDKIKKLKKDYAIYEKEKAKKNNKKKKHL